MSCSIKVKTKMEIFVGITLNECKYTRIGLPGMGEKEVKPLIVNKACEDGSSHIDLGCCC